MKAAAIKMLKKDSELQYVVDMEHIATSNLPEFLRERTLNSYYPGRTGQIMVLTHPQVFTWSFGDDYIGTTHGAWNPYDAHIPLLFMGWKIGHGNSTLLGRMPYRFTNSLEKALLLAKPLSSAIKLIV